MQKLKMNLRIKMKCYILSKVTEEIPILARCKMIVIEKIEIIRKNVRENVKK